MPGSDPVPCRRGPAFRSRAVRGAAVLMIAGAVLFGPENLEATPVAYTAYVGNYGSSTLTPINTATNATGSAIAIGTPGAVAITPDGTKAWVTNYSSATIKPVTLAT